MAPTDFDSPFVDLLVLGEVLYGFSAAYRPELKAFTMVPGDPDSNSLQVIVVAQATESVEYV